MAEENMALNEDVEVENNIDESPTSEAQATGEAEVPEAEVEEESAEDSDTEAEETDEETDGGSSKKGYSNRVRELNARAKKAEEEAKSLADKLNALTEVPEREYARPQQEELPPIVQPGEEIDSIEFDRRLKQREQRLLEKADALVTLRGKQQEAIQRINREAEESIRAYPELDPKSDSFNKELSEAISEATESYVMKNPYSAQVSKFVDKMMRPYKGAVSKEVGNMAGSMAKQVSEAATRPTSVRKQERPAEEKSIAELEAELGIVQA